MKKNKRSGPGATEIPRPGGLEKACDTGDRRVKKRDDRSFLQHFAWICGCRRCETLRRDAETARLILRHELALYPIVGGWSVGLPLDDGGHDTIIARSIHAAVRKAARASDNRSGGKR